MEKLEAQTYGIYRILIFKRGQDIGSLKIIAKTASKAFNIARKLMNNNPDYNPAVITFRCLQLITFSTNKHTEKLLSTEGVNINGG